MASLDFSDPGIVIRGCSWDVSVSEEPARDLTGCTPTARVRKAVADADPELELTVGSGLTVSAEDGVIAITLTPEQTAALDLGPHVIGIVIESGGKLEHVGDAELTVVDTAGRPGGGA